MTILRRLRGLLGISIVWAVAWSVMVLPAGIWWWFRLPCVEGCSPLAVLVLMKSVAWWGAMNGLLFALGLSLTSRRRSIAGLNAAHVIALGIAAGMWAPMVVGEDWWWMIIPFGIPAPLLTVASAGALGGSLAAILLTVARRPGSVAALPPDTP